MVRINTGGRSTACAVLLLFILSNKGAAQENATPNGITDNRANAYAFTGGVIYRPDGSLDDDVTLLIRDGSIVDIAPGNAVPAGFFEIDLAGKYVYPGLIDIYSEYGQEVDERVDNNGAAENLFPSDRALNVNDAIKANFRASIAFEPDEDGRKELRQQGFSTVLSIRRDGIARGTSALITLGEKNANEAIIVAEAAAHYSLDKGSSAQQMPVSLMG
ncbi:MAG: amidohydrolase, partial [Gammaproteobacteria bacterium]